MRLLGLNVIGKKIPIRTEIRHVKEDQFANQIGRLAPDMNGFQDCESTCALFVAKDQRSKFLKGPRLRGKFSFD